MLTHETCAKRALEMAASDLMRLRFVANQSRAKSQFACVKAIAPTLAICRGRGVGSSRSGPESQMQKQPCASAPEASHPSRGPTASPRFATG